MKSTLYIFLFLTLSVFSQEAVKTEFISKSPFLAEHIIGIDNFQTISFISNSTLFKKRENNTLNYSNIQLGEITSANTFNPLKINVFYKTFNAVIILDNRLSEIFKIDFNTISPYKNITHVSTGSDNTLWIYNQDSQQLELFDYKTIKTRAKSMPIESEVLDIASNYNACWILTKDHILKFNYFGSLLLKTKNQGFKKIKEHNGNLILQKDNTLFYLNKNNYEFQPISLPNLLINQFLVTNEILYIYNDEMLHQYQLKTK